MDVAPRIDPEYGPSLPELLRRRLSPRARRALAVVVAAVVAAGALAWALAPGEPVFVHQGEPVFNTRWKDGGRLKRVDAPPGAILRLEARRGGQVVQSFTVRALTLSASGGDANAQLPVIATAAERALAGQLSVFTPLDEGKARIDEALGYQLGFRAEQDGHAVFGRRLWLMDPEGDGRTGLIVDLLQRPGGSVRRVDDVGVLGPLRIPYRSLRFGTGGP